MESRESIDGMDGIIILWEPVPFFPATNKRASVGDWGYLQISRTRLFPANVGGGRDGISIVTVHIRFDLGVYITYLLLIATQEAAPSVRSVGWSVGRLVDRYMNA
jgi:hypothetical protein